MRRTILALLLALAGASCSRGEPAPREEAVAPAEPAFTGELVERELHAEETPLAWNLELALEQLGLHEPAAREQAPATSPDGRHVAWVEDAAPGWRTLYVRATAGGSDARRAVVSIGDVHERTSQELPFRYRWTADSRGLLVHGDGPVRGHGLDLPIAYHLDRDRLITMTPWFAFACHDASVRWRTGDPLERGLLLACLDPEAWTTAADALAWLGPADEEDAEGTLRWGLAIDESFPGSAGEYELWVRVSGRDGLVRGVGVALR